MQTLQAYESTLKQFMATFHFSSALDTDTAALKASYDALCNEQLLAFELFSPPMHEALKKLLFTHLCAKSGALGFLAIQHLAANKLMQQAQYDAAHQQACGIAINHLRAPVRHVEATKEGKRYILHGRLRWASGFGIFNYLLIGFHYASYEMHAVIPFAPQTGLHVSPIIETFSANSMNTRDITLDAFELDESLVIAKKEVGAYTQQKSLSKTVHYAFLGICYGALDEIGQMEDEQLFEVALQHLYQFNEAITRCDDASMLLKLRSELFFFAQQLITTAMVNVGGAASVTTSALQRLYRELMLFNANGLNAPMKAQSKEIFLARHFIDIL